MNLFFTAAGANGLNEVPRMAQHKNNARVGYSAPIVSKALKVLKMVITAPNNPGFSEIASKLNLAKSTTHGILAALEATGLLLRDPITRKYTCGFALKDIADKASVRVALTAQARPFLEELEQELDEDIFLGIFTGAQLLILDQVESYKELKIRARPGTRISKLAGAPGKLFLAYHDREAVERILRSEAMPVFTPHSITDPDKYISELEQVREAGVAQDVEEYLPNVWAVAVPIFYDKPAHKRMVAGFWVVGLNAEDKDRRIEAARRLGVMTGEALSRSISDNLE
jgi:IclR family KDG regulon transcriptional repressor